MLNLIRSWVAPKAAVRLILRGNFSQESGLKVQTLVQRTGVMGWLRIVRGSHVQMELEGSKPKLEALLVRLQQTSFTSTPTVLEVTWTPYKKQFASFRVSV